MVAVVRHRAVPAAWAAQAKPKAIEKAGLGRDGCTVEAQVTMVMVVRESVPPHSHSCRTREFPMAPEAAARAAAVLEASLRRSEP